MKCRELINILEKLCWENQKDMEVRAQSQGCCGHGHEIESVGVGGSAEKDKSFRWDDEEGIVIIRV